MSNRRGLAPLIAGLVLIAIGAIFLLENLVGLDLRWLRIAQYAIPLLLMWLGLTRLVRHFTWSQEELLNRPGKAGLLSGIFWTATGLLIFLDLLDIVSGLDFFGRYWPLVIILFGLGKVIDFYRLQGKLQFRIEELIGTVFVVLLGFAAAKAAEVRGEVFDLYWPVVIAGDYFPISIGALNLEEHRWEEQKSLSASGLQEIEIANLYGDVRVTATASDEVRIELAKVVFGNDQDKAEAVSEKIELVTRSEAGVLHVGTNRTSLPDQDYRFHTHLTLNVPQSTQTRVTAGYGDVRIVGLKAPCQVEDEYGDITIESVAGAVTVQNRRGSVALNNIEGDIQAATDYDSIRADNIVGNVSARNHFGSVRVNNVSGTTTITGDGSRVSVSNAAQAVDIKNSYEPVTANDIRAPLHLQTSYSNVNLSRISNPVTIDATHSRIEAKDLESSLSIRAKGSRVEVRGLGGDASISTSLERLSLEEFGGSVEAQNEFGEIRMTAGASLPGPITAINRHGDIRLSLAANAQFRLSASAPGGEIRSEFGETDSRRENLQVLNTAFGDGPEVKLQTEFASIRIDAEASGEERK
ncbi:MAG: DUF4097 family beta strand repeat-containing protein [Acidobacteriota bacterium]